MSVQQHESSVALRFEKVITFFLDGIPKPFVQVAPDVKPGKTFCLGRFGFLPDYTGQTKVVDIPEFQESEFFDPVCFWQCSKSSPSSRIGSHYSPYVGTFRLNAKSFDIRISRSLLTKEIARIPIDTCEETDKNSAKSVLVFEREADCELRTLLLIELYAKDSKDYLVHDRNSMRRIVVLASRGFTFSYKNMVENEIAELVNLYIRSCSQAIYEYLCRSSLFRRIVYPLCLKNYFKEDYVPRNLSGLYAKQKKSRVNDFKCALELIKQSLFWNKRSNAFFIGLNEIWVKRLGKLVLFDTSTTKWKTEAAFFLTQLGCSMRAAFTRIRIEFYTQVENMLFDKIGGSKEFLSLDSKSFKNSELNRIFLATRVLLTNRLRSMILDALKELVDFFLNPGVTVISPTKAYKTSVIEVNLVVGGCGLPRSPSFAQLRFGIIDLLDELVENANDLPTPEAVIMRVVDIEKRCINSFDIAEFSMRTLLLKYFDAAGCAIENLSTKYSVFSILPSLLGAFFTRTDEDNVKKNVFYLREKLVKISKVSPDFVYFGRIAINCVEVKKLYMDQWSHYLEKYLSAIRADILSFLQSSIEKSHRYNYCLSAEPQNVEELGELYSKIKAMISLADEIRDNECKQVIRWFDCMENWKISIDNSLYVTALELMRCPGELVLLAEKANALCTNSRPSILESLGKLRSDTRNKIKTINSGIDELSAMFNLEVCDIGAQTCQELRVVVDEVVKAIEYISFCENWLEIQDDDLFEDFVSVLNSFEVLEQFWGSVFDSTIVKNYYDTAVMSILPGKMIENVQRCRRLIHCSVRNLRSRSGLVSLGRQQEQVLADFESLEDFLDLITAPGLRKNHWKEISRLLEEEGPSSIHVDSSVTLRYLLERGILDHLDKLKSIVDPALIDFETESALEQMKSEAKKTRFVFEPVVGCKDAFVLSPDCRESIYNTLESFIGDCRSLNNQAFLSQFVVNSIREWEVSCEKMRIALLQWKEVEREWIEVLRYGMTLDSIGEREVPAQNSREWKFLHEKIISVNDIFSVYCATLQKRQYTLFTSIAQESAYEQLTLASTILGDVKKVISSLLDAKREAFPRFCFLTDDELLSFLSVLDPKNLTQMLCKMYSRVCNVVIENNAVVSYLTSGGAVLKANEPIELSSVPVERWMNNFDKTLRFSLLLEIQTRIKTYLHVDYLTWIQGSCSQVINMALRIMHYRDFCEVLSLAGSSGIAAYLKRLTDISDECVRLASGSLGRDVRSILFDSITFLSYSRTEVQTAMKTGVQSVEDLGMTAMFQTSMEKDKIYVQVLGLKLQYGFEFLGNYALPVFSPQNIEKGLYSSFFSFAGGSFPLFIGKAEGCNALHNCAEYLGRFWWPFQCRHSTTLESVMQALRGAISVGAVICLKDIGLVDKEIIPRITELVQRVSALCTSDIERQEKNSFIHLSLEPDGPSISVKRNPCFQLVFTSSRREEIPTALALAFRPIYLSPVDLSLVGRGVLQALGFSQCMSVGQRFAVMYEQFREVLPSIFSLRYFVAILQNSMDGRRGSILENLGVAFLNQFWPVVRSSNRLQKLLNWNATQTLGIPSDIWNDLLGKCKSEAGFDTVVERFAAFMEYSTNVMLVGSVFSGKTRLWKQWARDMPFFVLSLRLLSSEEIYGSVNRKGILSSLAKDWNALESRLIVVEDVDVSKNLIVFGAPVHTRIRPFEGPDFVKGPLCRVIAVVPKLVNANPYIMTEFAVFTLSEQNNWKGFLKEQLQASPAYYANTAYAAIVTMIGAIFDIWSSVKRTTTFYENPFSVALRCSQFYKRWYRYAESCCESRRVEWFTCEQAFALQCGVFTVCWSLGLCLPMDDRRLMRFALKKASGKLGRIAVDIGFTEEILPCMEDGILQYIATPMGWRKLGGPAEALGFCTPWSKQQTAFDFKRRTWGQFFALPSREQTHMMLELLINAGQPVLLVGAADEGKSTILRHLGCNERWVHHIASGNLMSGMSGIQESLISRLALRHSKTYGPPIGRKLILCVDDVHLPGTLGKEPSQAMYLFSFINRHAALCPPSLGFTPVTDIVCVGTSKPVSFGLAAEGHAMRILLPEICDTEFSRCVGNFLEQSCVSRRPLDIAAGVTQFITVAQTIALKIFCSERKNYANDNCDNDANDVKENKANGDETNAMNAREFPNSNPELTRSSKETKSFEEDTKQETTVGLSYTRADVPFSCRHLFLRASDRAVQLLASSWVDRDALANIFTATCGLYSTIIDSSRGRALMSQKMIEIGETTLRQSWSVKPPALEPDGPMSAESYEHDDTDLPPVAKADVLQWIDEYYRLLSSGAVEESAYVEPNASVVFAPPPQRAVRRSALRRSVAHVTLDALPSSWLTMMILAIHQAMRQDQLHVAVVGSRDIQIVYHAIRIWGVAARLHVALLRDDYTNNPAGIERFTRDFVEVLRRTCRNDGRMVLFVSHCVTAIPWAMGCIDTVVRSGNISQLFTFDEQLVLLYGHRDNRRIGGHLTATEYSQLSSRICRRLAVVMHVESLDAFASLGANYPFVTNLLPIPLCVNELRYELVKIIIDRVVTQWETSELAKQINRNSIGNPIASTGETVIGDDSHRLTMKQPTVQLLCNIFRTLAPRFSLKNDQLLEFSFQTQRLSNCLLEIRYEASRSRYILNLPTHITKKSSEYKGRIASAIPSKKAVEQQIDVKLRRISEESRRGERSKNALRRFQVEASALENRIRQGTEELKAIPNRIKNMLSAAENRVRALNASQIKAFAMLRMPEKGVLLVRAVCRVLGEELRHAAAQDIWNRGRDIMAAPKFIQRLVAVEPSNFLYESLASMHTALREVRYNEISSYATVVGDYVVTFMDAVHLANGMRNIHDRVERVRFQYASVLSDMQKFSLRIADAEMRTVELREELVPLRMKCDELDDLCDDMRKRQNVLESIRYAAERFSSYHSFDEFAARDAEKNGEAVVLFTAARFALFGLTADGTGGDRLTLDALSNVSEGKELLRSLGDEGQTVKDSTVMVLFPSLKNILGNALMSSLSLIERMCVGSVLQRTFLRWPLFAGASPVFERVMRLILFRMCGDVVVISAINSTAREALVNAARLGCGVLLCDVSAAMTSGKLRPLFELRSSLVAAQDRNDQVLSCCLFGQRVDIRTSFFLVCLSPSAVLSDRICNCGPNDSSDDEADSIRRLLALVCPVNVTAGADVSAPYHTTLLLSVGDAADLDDLDGVPREEVEAVAAFHKTIQTIRELLCLNLDKLSANVQDEIETLETLIGDLGEFHMHVERTEMQQQIMRSRVKDAWRNVELALRGVERALQRIDGETFGRKLISQKLYAIVTRAGNLPRRYISRITPNTFAGLSDSHKEFYVAVVLIERAVQVFACGWPRGLRGILALYVLSSAVMECELIQRLRGDLYSGATYLLNRSQFDVLHSLLFQGKSNSFAFASDTVTVENANFEPLLNDAAPTAQQIYESSSDDLLRNIAEELSGLADFSESTPGTLRTPKTPALSGGTCFTSAPMLPAYLKSENPVCIFFKQWAMQDFAMCDIVASMMYDAFFFAVKDICTSDDDEASKAYNFSSTQPVEVHSVDELAQQSMYGGTPSFACVTNVIRAIKYIFHSAMEEHLPYHICHVTTPESAAQLMDVIFKCFNTRPTDQAVCHRIVATITPGAESANDTALARKLAYIFTQFTHYAAWGARRGSEHEPFPIFLTFIMQRGGMTTSEAAAPLIRADSCAALLEDRCMLYRLGISDPRFHLRTLMERQGAVSPWRSEGGLLVLNPSSTVTLSFSPTSTAVKTLRKSAMATSSSHSRRSTRVDDTVRLANVVELHVGIVSMQTMRRALWDRENFGTTDAATAVRLTIDDDDLLLILRLIAIWVRSTAAIDEKNSGDVKRTSHLAASRGSLLNQRHSFLDREPFSAHRRRDRLQSVLCKIAYGIYSARVTTEQERQRLADRIGCLMGMTSAFSQSQSFSADDTASDGIPSETVVLAELRQSSNDFLSFFGDAFTAFTNTQTFADATYRVITGSAHSSAHRRSLMSAAFNCVVESDVDRPTAQTSTTIAAPGDAMGIVSLWENTHAERLAETLSAAGNKAAAELVRAAADRLRQWLPGDTLAVWFPALRHPHMLLSACTARAVSRKASDVDDANSVEAVLVLLRRYSVLRDDVILVGAALSEMLEEEVLLRTCWERSHLAWRRESANLRDMCDGRPDDIVLAVRFQRCRLGDVAVGSANEMLWEVRSGEKRLKSALQAEPPRTARPSVMFTSGVPPVLSVSEAHEAGVQGLGTLPLVCASATVAQNESMYMAGRGEAVMVSRVGCDWRILTEMPLLVSLTEEEWILSSFMREAQEEGGEAVHSRNKSSVFFIDGSLGFFVIIS